MDFFFLESEESSHEKSEVGRGGGERAREKEIERMPSSQLCCFPVGGFIFSFNYYVQVAVKAVGPGWRSNREIKIRGLFLKLASLV